MEIKVLGSGCASCKRLEALAREVVGELEVPAEIEKVTDFKQIMSYGILATPGLVIDGEVKSAGRIPNKAELSSWITSARAAQQA
ncbi:MAG: thioredoxin family protein [Chloroflexi bacterium]|nr:thioredoxin family protein [Chloroflexota bacterium]MCL5111138.1 thioredoxin family protein [Chloroflexota bacterium]